MRKFIKMISVFVCLLMIVSIMSGCNTSGKGKNDSENRYILQTE